MNDCVLLRRENNAAHIRTTIEETAAMRPSETTAATSPGRSTLRQAARPGTSASTVAETPTRRSRNSTVTTSSTWLSATSATLPQLQDLVQNVGAAMTLVDGCRDLSDIERETLETAVYGGYFESPRDATLGSLAEEFDVSKPAVSKNLRRGERKMIERVVEALDDIED